MLAVLCPDTEAPPFDDVVNKMKLFLNFLRQQVPKSGGEVPYYYQQSIRINDQMLAFYFFLSFVLISWATKQFFWLPIAFQVLLLLKLYYQKKLSVRFSLLLYTLLVFAWCWWYVVSFGWELGGQHILTVLVLLVFFCLYEPPITKLAYFLAIFAMRMYLFSYGSSHAPLIELDSFARFLLQMVNTSAMFLILASCCIVYSSNLQETERQLLLRNQQLKLQAQTDPLTKLINRRGFTELMNSYVSENPEAMYCVAIADIDFFKRVNDTYGHNCGDYTLQKLAALFMERAADQYYVSRWGGEEFCFFFPGVNIDDAGRIITELMLAVRKMELEYEGHRFSITLTAGVEENDYRSPLSELIESADRKLYRGKQNGRDQIVF